MKEGACRPSFLIGIRWLEEFMSLIDDLNRSALRYVTIRCRYSQLVADKCDLSVIESERTIAHNSLISCFDSCLRGQVEKDPEMIKAHSGGRAGIARWAINYVCENLL